MVLFLVAARGQLMSKWLSLDDIQYCLFYMADAPSDVSVSYRKKMSPMAAASCTQSAYVLFRENSKPQHEINAALQLEGSPGSLSLFAYTTDDFALQNSVVEFTLSSVHHAQTQFVQRFSTPSFIRVSNSSFALNSDLGSTFRQVLGLAAAVSESMEVENVTITYGAIAELERFCGLAGFAKKMGINQLRINVESRGAQCFGLASHANDITANSLTVMMSAQNSVRLAGLAQSIQSATLSDVNITITATDSRFINGVGEHIGQASVDGLQVIFLSVSQTESAYSYVHGVSMASGNLILRNSVIRFDGVVQTTTFCGVSSTGVYDIDGLAISGAVEARTASGIAWKVSANGTRLNNIEMGLSISSESSATAMIRDVPEGLVVECGRVSFNGSVGVTGRLVAIDSLFGNISGRIKLTDGTYVRSVPLARTIRVSNASAVAGGDANNSVIELAVPAGSVPGGFGLFSGRSAFVNIKLVGSGEFSAPKTVGLLQERTVAPLTLQGCSFEASVANHGGGHIAALFGTVDHATTISNCSFVGAIASAGTASIVCDEQNSNIVIRHSLMNTRLTVGSDSAAFVLTMAAQLLIQQSVVAPVLTGTAAGAKLAVYAKNMNTGAELTILGSEILVGGTVERCACLSGSSCGTLNHAQLCPQVKHYTRMDSIDIDVGDHGHPVHCANNLTNVDNTTHILNISDLQFIRGHTYGLFCGNAPVYRNVTVILNISTTQHQQRADFGLLAPVLQTDVAFVDLNVRGTVDAGTVSVYPIVVQQRQKRLTVTRASILLNITGDNELGGLGKDLNGAVDIQESVFFIQLTGNVISPVALSGTPVVTVGTGSRVFYYISTQNETHDVNQISVTQNDDGVFGIFGEYSQCSGTCYTQVTLNQSTEQYNFHGGSNNYNNTMINVAGALTKESGGSLFHPDNFPQFYNIYVKGTGRIEATTKWAASVLVQRQRHAGMVIQNLALKLDVILVDMNASNPSMAGLLFGRVHNTTTVRNSVIDGTVHAKYAAAVGASYDFNSGSNDNGIVVTIQNVRINANVTGTRYVSYIGSQVSITKAQFNIISCDMRGTLRHTTQTDSNIGMFANVASGFVAIIEGSNYSVDMTAGSRASYLLGVNAGTDYKFHVRDSYIGGQIVVLGALASEWGGYVGADAANNSILFENVTVYNGRGISQCRGGLKNQTVIGIVCLSEPARD